MMPLTLLADAFRRNPYPVYSVLRRVSPVIRLRATASGHSSATMT